MLACGYGLAEQNLPQLDIPQRNALGLQEPVDHVKQGDARHNSDAMHSVIPDDIIAVFNYCTEPHTA